MRAAALIMLALLLVGAAGAEQSTIYRWEGPDGTVHFSDAPRPGAEEVIVAPTQTVPALRAPRTRPGGDNGDRAGRETGYDRFAFSSPADDAGIRANDGTVNVAMALSPPLRPGHRIQVYLDGEPMGGNAPLSFEVPGMTRGTHTIRAEVLDRRDEVVASAGPVTFHVLRVHLGGGQ